MTRQNTKKNTTVWFAKTNVNFATPGLNVVAARIGRKTREKVFLTKKQKQNLQNNIGNQWKQNIPMHLIMNK